MNGIIFLIQKKKQLIFGNIIIFNKEKIKLYQIIIFIFFTNIILSNSEIDENDLNESIYSYITLKIGKGNNKVYSLSKAQKIVYINEIKQSNIQINYIFDETENSVILIWEKPITNCEAMFQHCDKITKN